MRSGRLTASRSHGRLDAELREALLVEVLPEHVAQLRRRRVVGRLVLPGVPRIEDLGRDAGAALRDLQVEDGVRLELDLVELAGERGVQQRARVRDRHALADAERAAAPAGVEQDA